MLLNKIKHFLVASFKNRMDLTLYKACLWIVLVSGAAGSDSSCQDIDPNGCLAMAKQNPDMCQDAVLSRSVCPKLCKNCPLTCYSCQTLSYDMSSCNTITCSKNQKCLTQSTSEIGPFTLSCDSDMICNGRNDDGPFVQNGQAFQCCNSDLCNIPVRPTIPPPTVPPYRECARDIPIFLDQSEPLVHNWTDVKKFLTDIISTMDIGPYENQTRVAMTLFDGIHHVKWLFDSFNHNRSELLLQIQTLVPHLPNYAPNGNFNSAVVVLLHNQHIYNSERHNNNQVVSDVPIFISGSSGRRNDVMLAEMRKIYDNIITIGIGNITDKDSVSYIASDSNHAFFLDSSEELLTSTMEHKILNLICG